MFRNLAQCAVGAKDSMHGSGSSSRSRSRSGGSSSRSRRVVVVVVVGRRGILPGKYGGEWLDRGVGRRRALPGDACTAGEELHASGRDTGLWQIGSLGRGGKRESLVHWAEWEREKVWAMPWTHALLHQRPQVASLCVFVFRCSACPPTTAPSP